MSPSLAATTDATEGWARVVDSSRSAVGGLFGREVANVRITPFARAHSLRSDVVFLFEDAFGLGRRPRNTGHAKAVPVDAFRTGSNLFQGGQGHRRHVAG
jgi:hypothetical protein